jgi:two-component sensor histidine kinase
VCGIATGLAEQAPNHRIECDIDAILISADTAIPVGLLVTELVTNAIKYAYDDAGGAIAVTIRSADGRIVLTVSDTGAGLPADFDLKTASRKSLGMRMIGSLARQLRGTVTIENAAVGTCATLDVPDPRVDAQS